MSHGAPLWTPAAQAQLYEGLGYAKVGTREDGTPWTRPAETDRFLYDWAHRFHVVICPARASKSYSAAKKVLPLILGRAPKSDGSGPRPTRGWIVGPTFTLAEKEFGYVFTDLVQEGPRRFGWPKPLIARFSKQAGDMYLMTAWGSEVIGKSADKPQSLLGEQLDWVVLSEAAQLSGDIWTRYLEPRLSTTKGYAIFPTTPDSGALWLYELHMKAREAAAGAEDWAAHRWGVEGNPIYPLEERARALRFYGGDHPVYREQYLGEWTFYEGTVYGHDFSESRHLIEPFEIPREWRRIRAIDFGYRDPFVCLWFAVAESSERYQTLRGDLLLYREYYQTGRPMAEHAEAIRRLSEDEPILYSVADSSEQQSIADLRRLGIACLDANRDRRAGRMLVGDYFRADRLKFLRGRCPRTLQELRFYRWDHDRNKEGAKEATIGDDHAMDALRYVVMSRPQPRPPTFTIPEHSFAGELQRRERERLRQQWPTLAAWRS